MEGKEEIRVRMVVVKKTKGMVVDKQLLVIYNIFEGTKPYSETNIEEKMPMLSFYPSISVSVIDASKRHDVLAFILQNYDSKNQKMDLLPFLKKDGSVLAL